MALSFIKKVFSFGQKEVDERPAEDEPLAPLNFAALREMTAGPPAAAVAEAAGRELLEAGPPPIFDGKPADHPPPGEVDGAPAAPVEAPAAWLDVRSPPVELPAPVETPRAEPVEPDAPAAEAGEPLTEFRPAPVEVPEPPGAAPAPLPGGRDHAPFVSAVPPAASPPSAPPAIPAPRPAGKVTVGKLVEKKAEQRPAGPAPEPRKSWFQRLREGLSRSSRELTGSIAGIFTKRKLDDATLEELEDVLIRADLGMETALRVTDTLASSRYGKDVSEAEVRAIMAQEVEKVLAPVARPLELDLSHKPHVILVVGVNGTGKTTTIGKLAAKLRQGGLSVMLAAGDTFRAAAIEQLKIWGERTGSPVVSSKIGADAAGLAWDAFEKAKAEGADVLIIDTAGRLQNRTELMAELEKIVRVLGKHDPEAPHTVLQTVDATTGQNALSQVEIFRNVAGVNGLVMTKLDGTARGGILVAIAAKHKLPVYFIGVGEQVEDLEPFSANEFARAIAGVG